MTESNQELTALLAQTGLGDRRAFATLYESTKSKLFGVSLRIVKERQLAEEVLQDSFVNIWNNARNYTSEKAAPMTWLTAIVRNRSLDLVRRPHLETQDEDDFFTLNMVDEALSPAAALTQKRDATRVENCMRALDADQRQAIALAFFDGLSHAEVATHLKKPLGTIKTHVRRGMIKMKDCLGAQHEEAA